MSRKDSTRKESLKRPEPEICPAATQKQLPRSATLWRRRANARKPKSCLVNLIEDADAAVLWPYGMYFTNEFPYGTAVAQNPRGSHASSTRRALPRFRRICA